MVNVECGRTIDLTRKIEWAVFAVLCLLAVCLNVLVYRNSGAFWRDEAATINVATAPRLGTMWAWLSRDSFPVLFTGLLRFWIFAGPGATDAGMRLLGILISLGIPVSLFISCWALVGRVPLLAMPLVAFNATVFHIGSSLRAYGLDALLIMLCCAAFWRLARKPTRWNIAASFALAVLSSHTTYQNTYLLLGIGVAGAAVCGLCRLWKRSLLILGVCFAAALSMLIYIPAINKYQEAHMVARPAEGWGEIGQMFITSLAGNSLWLLTGWATVLLGTCAFLMVTAFSRRHWQSARQMPSLSLFCLLALSVAGGCGLAFFRASGTNPFLWHYIPFIVFVGIMIEAAAVLALDARCPWARILICLALIGFSLPGAWRVAHLRRTDLDLVCGALVKNAGPNDLILVCPFYLSPGVNYYYHGSTRWSTLPMVPDGPDMRICPYYSIKRAAQIPNALAPTLQEIEKTLSAGHRLWIVGGVSLPTENDKPPEDVPSPSRQMHDWTLVPYVNAWVKQVGYFMHKHHTKAYLFTAKTDHPVSHLEMVPLMCYEGWQALPGDETALPELP